MRILTYRQLADKLRVSINTVRIFLSRSEFDKFRTKKMRCAAVICNKESMKLLGDYLKIKAKYHYMKDFTMTNFENFVRSL